MLLSPTVRDKAMPSKLMPHLSTFPHCPPGTTKGRLPPMVADVESLSSDSKLRRSMTKAALTGLFHLAGIDYRVKTVTVDNVQVALQLWDTAGQER